MTPEIAIEYIRRRTIELGYGDDYHMRFRHYIVERLSTITIEGATALFLLVDPNTYVRVESEMGLFDLTETAANELQYEHQGNIRLTNYSTVAQHVQMIQVIFKV